MAHLIGLSGSLREGSYNAAEAFDADGRLLDESIEANLRRFVAGFCEYADALGRTRG